MPLDAPRRRSAGFKPPKAKQPRDYRAGEGAVRAQSEMELRAGTCLEREQADERSFFVEQATATRTRIERGRGAQR